MNLAGDPAAWNAYVAAHPAASLYHRYEWLGVIERAFGHRALPLAAPARQGVEGVLPLVLMNSRLFGRCAVSLPFVNYGGVLADSAEIERSLWERAVQAARDAGARSLEARHVAARPFIHRRKRHKVCLVLSLASSVEAQWNAFRPTLRNRIRKAQASGLCASIEGASGLSGFYRVFARNMRDLGTPVYPRRFFEEILNAFPGAARIFIVSRRGEAVAAALALAHRDTLEVPWICSRRDALALCPNHHLYWEMIQHAIKSGLRRVDFGRSSPGTGACRFKQVWGAEEVPLVWEYWTADGAEPPDLNPRNPRYAFAVALWKRLPLPIATSLGPRIVRNIP